MGVLAASVIAFVLATITFRISDAVRPATEAAAAQGRFFARAIFDDQDNQRPSDIIYIAHDLGLDVEQFEKDLISAEVTGRVRDDILDAEAMNITARPDALHQRPPARRPVRRAVAAASAHGPDRHTSVAE